METDYFNPANGGTPPTTGSYRSTESFGHPTAAGDTAFPGVAEQSPLVLWAYGADGRLEVVNQAYLEFFGLAASRPTDVCWDPFVHPGDRGFLKQFEDALHDRRPLQAEVRMRNAAGEWRWLDLSGRPSYGTNRQFAGYVGGCVDISDRKRDEERLRRANRNQSRSLACLAHELRGPLGAIANAVECATQASGDEDAGDALEVAKRQIRLVSRLVDDLTDVAGISRGKLSLARQRIDLRDVLADALAIETPRIEARKHNLGVDVSSEPIWVYADAQRLAQVVANVLANAAKYTPEGGEIGVSLRARETTADLRVRDTGHGIAPSDLQRIFGMFQQLDQAPLSTHAGLGIGLALAKRLTEQHGGTISARSDGLGHGSEFTISLPTAPPPFRSHPTPITGLSASAATGPAHSPDSKRILLVDDDVWSSEALKTLLSLQGHHVEIANDAAEGMEKLLSFAPQIAILDLTLPDLSGMELAAHMHASPSATPKLIALTGWTRQAVGGADHPDPFDHFMVKPVDFDLLQQAIATPGDGEA